MYGGCGKIERVFPLYLYLYKIWIKHFIIRSSYVLAKRLIVKWLYKLDLNCNVSVNIGLASQLKICQYNSPIVNMLGNSSTVICQFMSMTFPYSVLVISIPFYNISSTIQIIQCHLPIGKLYFWYIDRDTDI